MLACLLGRLRWTPREVWRATPREVAAALGGGAAPMRAAELRDLMTRFPDREPGSRDQFERQSDG